MTLDTLIGFPQVGVTDCFQKAADAVLANPELWAVFVRNEETIRLYQFMVELLKRLPVDEIVDYTPVDDNPPLYVQEMKQAFLDMNQPLIEGVQKATFRLTGQSWRSTSEEIGKFHADPAAWVALLSTYPTTRFAIQKTPPNRHYTKLYSEDDMMRRDRNTHFFEPSAGTSLIMRGLGEDNMTAFHEIPRCMQGNSRLCLAIHA